MRSIKKNNLRFWYFLYLLILITIMTIILFVALKLDYYKSDVLRIIFIFFIVKFILQIVCILRQLIKMSMEKENKNIDEREAFIMSRAAAIGGVVAFTFMPFIYIFVFILPQYLVIASVVYVLLVDITINTASIVYQKKL